MPGWDALGSTQPLRPKSRFHMMSLAGERDGGRPGALGRRTRYMDCRYSRVSPERVWATARSSLAVAGLITACAACVSCGVEEQLGSWVGNVWGLGVVSVHDQTQQQSWHELAGVGSHMHGEALRGHAPSVSSP